MTLLEIERVSKCYGRGSRERVALHDVTLHVDLGELVAVWGQRHSGRSTLLKIAAGLEKPDAGRVSFEGRDLDSRSGKTARAALHYCRRRFNQEHGELVLDQLVTGQLMRGVPPSLARTRARDALARVDATRCGGLHPSELSGSEIVLVSIARALAHLPKLLVIDEPAVGVELRERDRILLLLRSLTEDGTAVLMTTGDTTGLSGTDRALLLSKGELRGEPGVPGLAPVVNLPTIDRRQSA
jgi:putative ABC transport system ATP-binding protein